MDFLVMTSSNGNIFRVTGHLCGEFTGPVEFPAQKSVTRSFDVFFDLRLNKRLSKQPWGWWFETPSWSLWRQCHVLKLISNHNILFRYPIVLKSWTEWNLAFLCNVYTLKCLALKVILLLSIQNQWYNIWCNNGQVRAAVHFISYYP